MSAVVLPASRVADPLAELFSADLRSRGFSGEVALLVCDLSGGPLLSLNPGRSFPAASTIKVPLLVLALALAQAGELDLRARVVMNAEDRVPGSGVLHDLDAGLELSWLDVLTLMTVVSDNTATNLLIARLGVAQVNAWLLGQGWKDTHLVGPLQLPPERQNEAQRRGERNRTTARDQADLLRRLWARELLDEPHTALALDILGRQQHRDLIGRRVPRTADGDLQYRVASKSGELRGVHHDVGLLFTPRPLIVTLLSEGGTDSREHPENRDISVLADALWPVLARLGEVGGTEGSAGGHLTAR